MLRIFSLGAQWIRTRLRRREEAQSSFVDLAPTDKADQDGIYSRALLYATNNPNVSNIALTGPYGSGKSSIIRAFLKKYDRPVLPISLAAFLPEVGNLNAAAGHTGPAALGAPPSTQEIERSILQQMLYGADANSLPLSRFKRIKSPSWWAWSISLYIVVGVFACWHLLSKHEQIGSGEFFKPFDYSNWFNILTSAIGFLFVWQISHHLYVKSFGVSLKGLSLNDIELAPELTSEESILNKHLDEIIYFFQSTDYDLVVIEDLDRFDNPDIFVSLREINSLINRNAGIRRHIRFLYALRDSMFINTERTKFFEFIVPVIPIINTSNSIDKVIEQGSRLSLDDRLDGQFLRDVSRYLNDLRLIQNIFNEYAIYRDKLELRHEYYLDPNKLLSVLIYKNIFPGDFEDLHRGKGRLAKIISNRELYISGLERKYKSEIDLLESKMSAAELVIPANIEELRKIYAMNLLSKLPMEYPNIEFNGLRTPSNEIWNRQDFDQLVEASQITGIAMRGHSVALNLNEFHASFRAHKTYKERKSEVERKSQDFIEQSLKIISQLRANITAVRGSKFNELIRGYAPGGGDLFDDFSENGDLVKFLVFEGFLDDTYYQYTSLFHAGRLSPRDNNFLIQIRSFQNPDPDFQIDNPKEVVAAMRDDDFHQPFVLNNTLVDCLLENESVYQSQINGLVQYISLNFNAANNFLLSYYSSGKNVGQLLNRLAEHWSDLPSAMIGDVNNAVHIANLIARFSETDLEDLGVAHPNLLNFLSSNLSRVLATRVDFHPDRLALLPFKVKTLRSIEPYPAVARVLCDNGMYSISIENFDFIFRNIVGWSAPDELLTMHYTTVLRSGYAAVVDRIERDFGLYISNVLIQIEQNKQESVATIVKTLKHDGVKVELLERFVEKQDVELPSLSDLPERIHTSLFRLRKIVPSWGNCLAYLSSESFDAGTLTAFLSVPEVVSRLARNRIDPAETSRVLGGFLVENDNFTDDNYRRYIGALPFKVESFPEKISTDKKRILVEEAAVIFSSSSFSAIEIDRDLAILFVAKNIDAYLMQPDTIALGDDFLEELLVAKISVEQKVKVVRLMDLTALPQFARRASLIAHVFHNSGEKIGNLSSAVVQALITNSGSDSARISLFNSYHDVLSEDEVRATLQKMPTPFSEIGPGWRQPSIPNTEENLKFVNWLEARSIISSSKLSYFGNDIRIHNFRK